MTAGARAARRRVVIVGGGASGTLTAIQLLRRAPAGVEVRVVEPRAALGRGVAFGTDDPWHRLNVPAVTMTGLPEDPEHFRRWAAVPPASFPPRAVFGRYLGALLEDAAAASPATLEHLRARVTGLRDAGAALEVTLDDGRRVDADAVVLATGNELPRVPPFLEALAAAGDARVVLDPWAPGALDGVEPGETAIVVGTGHTALDLVASLLVGRGAGHVLALSRHAELPRTHEDPWRPRPPRPIFDAETFARFADPLEEARSRIRADPRGWRQAMDSLRPIHRELWLALGEDHRRRFTRDWRREWEIHRSRISAPVARDVASWLAGGRLEVRSAQIRRVVDAGAGLRVDAVEGSWRAARVLLATGPDESPGANPALASAIGAGLARAGTLGIGIDVDPYSYRVRDGSGSTGRALFALGPIVRGSVWESIAIPEIRVEAATIAADILGIE